jgi:hypothetical protein
MLLAAGPSEGVGLLVSLMVLLMALSVSLLFLA